MTRMRPCSPDASRSELSVATCLSLACSIVYTDYYMTSVMMYKSDVVHMRVVSTCHYVLVVLRGSVICLKWRRSCQNAVARSWSS